MTTLISSRKPKPSPILFFVKWAVVLLSILITGYLVTIMYAQGEILFALLTLVMLGGGIYIFTSQRAYSWRYVFPGLSGIGVFILFPLISTIAIGFTNYSSKNQLTYERAQSVLMSRQSVSGEVLNFALHHQGEDWVLAFTDSQTGENFVSNPFSLNSPLTELVDVVQTNDLPVTEKATPKEVTSARNVLKSFIGLMPDGREIRMKSLREFAVTKPLYILQEDGETLKNVETGVLIRPNFEVGFFQQIDENGNFIQGTNTESGFSVSIGWDNFIKVFTDKNIRGPFFSIFIWTVAFSALTVFFTTALGTILASLVQWEALRGRAIYRVLLILPYAVPSFISILIFRGLFNQKFGEINQFLDLLFGISPEWFNDPFLAKAMVVIVNTWLGYPYMMILCMGLLKAIPDDLYEASALNGATPWQNFTKITLPLLIKPLTPLMIASFAFNFNNFVLIMLLTRGGPNMTNTTAPAGHTDLLVSYTYRIAFEGGGGENFGLAAAISTIIFLIVGALAIINMKASRMKFD
ncbi:maltose ABC transporter permease MalF [Thorsellia anophelis]|uniref:Maltose/maltodextrin transport system permease protein n=1 Tax=Thorsellia anophelis DSM 18579 TaxID=1123402 RepID=A0A1I0DL64_9GAMM|nr:maltose ABC transporter permease MalF [Thorsellia anophelis]SET32834.1 maltose/maltodextrin transport system permease protein [Thorsellia anophelis DSM 18579]